ncbi:MAG: iron-sulfur cluster assembly scaffold protein [Pacificimonas sp.]|jgi:NifU-like protein involved in Fe-S cluster formation|nr:iron-sulfur cluster assembly scaffold protein [Pacificimonas sp.]
MSEPLYNSRILRLAAEVPHFGRLDAPMGTARKVSPVCGSRVDADVDVNAGGRINRFAQDVRACALGQASASLLGSRVIGLSGPEIVAAGEALGAYLRAEGPLPGGWPELEIFGPAQAHKARHASILLPFLAAGDAATLAAASQAA